MLEINKTRKQENISTFTFFFFCICGILFVFLHPNFLQVLATVQTAPYGCSLLKIKHSKQLVRGTINHEKRKQLLFPKPYFEQSELSFPSCGNRNNCFISITLGSTAYIQQKESKCVCSATS